MHHHLALTWMKVALSTPGRRLEAGHPGLSAPVHPHVVDCREDKRCEAIAKSAHDCIDCVCSQTESASSVRVPQAYMKQLGFHPHLEKRSILIWMAAGI